MSSYPFHRLRKRISILMFVIIIMGILPIATAYAEFVCLAPQNISNNDGWTDLDPQTADGKVVWSGYDSNDFEIYLYDIVSSTKTNISGTNGLEDSYPQIADGKVVWSGYDGTYYQIYLYDIALGTKTNISLNNLGSNFFPQIAEGKVMWWGWDGNDWEIYLYDIALDTKTNISNSNGWDDFDPRIADGKVVWFGWDGNDNEIYLYDIALSTKTNISNNDGRDDRSPQIAEGKVVWYGDEGSDYEIYLYDIALSTKINISDNDGLYDEFPQIADGKVVWFGWDGNDTEIYLYDIASSITTNISNTDGLDDEVPQIAEGKVVWYGSDGNDTEIYLYDIASSTKTNISNTDGLDDSYPQIAEGKVVWYGSDGNDNEIYLSNCGDTPTITTQPVGGNTASGATFDLSVVATGGGTLTYQWYEGTSGVTTTPVDGATSADFTTPALSATTSYWVQVSSEFGTIDSDAATVTVGDAPVITTQPVGGTIASGATFDLSVVAEGDGTLAYQWYEGESGTTTTPVDGATSADFTTPALSATTSYWVQVSSEFGTTDSDTATVIVGDAPVITTQPASIAIDYDASTTLSVVAEGGGTLVYQWYVGESGDTTSAIDGATSAEYATPNLKADASYWVRVSTEFGTVDSDTAVVSILADIVSEDFEDKTAFEASWTLKGNLAGDKIKCNKDKDGDGVVDKIVANNGECAFQFKGSAGEKTSFRQVINYANALRAVDAPGAGDTLTLSFYANGKSDAVNVKAKVRASYPDDTKAKITIPVSATSDYEFFSDSVDLTQDVVKLKVQFGNKSQSSKAFIDDVVLSASETPITAVGVDAIPLPDAPEGFNK